MEEHRRKERVKERMMKMTMRKETIAATENWAWPLQHRLNYYGLRIPRSHHAHGGPCFLLQVAIACVVDCGEVREAAPKRREHSSKRGAGRSSEGARRPIERTGVEWA